MTKECRDTAESKRDKKIISVQIEMIFYVLFYVKCSLFQQWQLCSSVPQMRNTYNQIIIFLISVCWTLTTVTCAKKRYFIIRKHSHSQNTQRQVSLSGLASGSMIFLFRFDKP